MKSQKQTQNPKMAAETLTTWLSTSFILILATQPCLCLKSCSFKHQGCTYNIHLSHHAGHAHNERAKRQSSGKCLPAMSQHVDLDQVQNDYSAKIDDMQKNFSFLKDTHEQRLQELETSLLELVGSGNNSPKHMEEVSKRPGGQSHVNLNQDLLDRLETEFNKLRDEIRHKSEELMDTKFKLNETSSMMHEAQLKHFKTGHDLVDLENQINMLRRERSILKNQLKDKSYRLEVSGNKARDCETKSTDRQDKMIQLFRSESTLKEELLITQMLLNETKAEMSQVKRQHSHLKSRHERVRTVMRKRERELMKCYRARTSMFCGFEDPEMCGFTNINDTSDFFDWTRGKGRTPSARTGPSQDHTCGGKTGHFMYIEASAKGRGNNAILYSPLYRGMKEQCVEFFYHMKGRHMGTLNVYAQARGHVLNSAWRAYGNQGDVWTSARIAIPKELSQAGYQLAFEGITENGYQGDMAIDDVSVRDGVCPRDVNANTVTVNISDTSVIKSGKKFAQKIRRKLKRYN